MTDTNGHPEKKLTLPVEWSEEGAIEIPLQVRRFIEQLPALNAPLRPRTDTTPPFRQPS